MKFASDEKAQIQKALWEVVRTASMALMKLNEIEGEEEKLEEEEKPQRTAKKVEAMPINPTQKTLSMAE